MSKQTIGIIVAAVVVFVGILIFGFSGDRSGTLGDGAGGSDVVGSAGPTTRESLSRNVVIVVPEVGEKPVSENIAVPSAVGPGDPSGATSYRDFSLKVEGGKFIPDTVTVYVGDTININIAAIDDDYDFFQPDYGLRGKIAKGATIKIQFGATAPGRFTFFCESCGGPEKGPVGYIIIAPKT